jgi:hypothetical protein
MDNGFNVRLANATLRSKITSKIRSSGNPVTVSLIELTLTFEPRIAEIPLLRQGRLSHENNRS